MEALLTISRKYYQNEVQQTKIGYDTRIGVHKISDANLKNIQIGQVAVYTFFRISSPNSKRSGKRLFIIQGEPGAGKTEFIRNLMTDWVDCKEGKEKSSEDLAQFDLLVALDGSRIKANQDMYDVFRKRLFQNYKSHALEKIFQSDSTNCKILLAIDGADDTRTLDFIKNCVQHVSDNTTIVVTCRPWMSYKFLEMHSAVAIQLELNDFMKEQRRNMLLYYDVDETHIFEINKKIAGCSDIIYNNPLHIYLGALIWKDKNEWCMTKIELFEEAAALLYKALKLKEEEYVDLWKHAFKDVKDRLTETISFQRKGSFFGSISVESKIFQKIRTIREFLAANFIIHCLNNPTSKDSGKHLTEWNHILVLANTLKFCCSLSFKAAEILLPDIHSVILSTIAEEYHRNERKIKLSQEGQYPYSLTLDIWQGPISVIIDQTQYVIEEECLSVLLQKPDDNSPLRQLFPYAIYFIGQARKIKPIYQFVQVLILKGQIIDRVLRKTINLRYLNLQDVTDLDLPSSYERFAQDIIQSGSPIRQVRMVGCGLDADRCQELSVAFSMLSYLNHLDVHENYDLKGGVLTILKALSNGIALLTYLNMETCGISEDMCADIADYLLKLPSLKNVNFSRNPLRNGAASIIVALSITAVGLEELRLVFCDMPFNMADAFLQRLPVMKKLRLLDLRFNHFQNKIFDIESFFKELNKNVELRLQYNFSENSDNVYHNYN